MESFTLSTGDLITVMHLGFKTPFIKLRDQNTIRLVMQLVAKLLQVNVTFPIEYVTSVMTMRLKNNPN